MASGFSNFPSDVQLSGFPLRAYFFSATSTAANITELTFRADWGQMDTHRIQEIHRSLSVRLGSLGSMACTGHFAAHNPQLVHSLVGLGTMPEPPAFL